MKVIRTLGLLAVITLGMLLACEGLARASLWRGPAGQPPLEFGFSRNGFGDLRPNLQTVVRLSETRPFYLQTNSAGLRNLDEISQDPGVARILAVGDSFTYGYFVDNIEAYPARLEEALNQHYGARRVQVLNAGVPGYTIVDEWSYVQEKGLLLRPQVVVLGVYTNDIFDMDPDIRRYFGREAMLATGDIPQAEQSTAGGWLRRNSALFTGLLRLAGRVEDARIDKAVNQVTPFIPGLDQRYLDLTFLNPGKPEYAPMWAAYESTLRAMIDGLRAEGIPLVIALFPDLNQLPVEGGQPTIPQDFFARVAAETGTLYVDLLPVYRAAGDVQSLYLMHYNPDAAIDPAAPDAAVRMFSGDGHPSPYGNLVAARAIAEVILNQGWLSAE